ncbi:carbohydrate ABC transporter permease [Demequina sp. SYSU T00039]|uniref:Carbohydrate ABC transporter permease n=1 Tax=Demequina lignilytica TaxID=3051663 RepID=A0AAW7M4F2_9MICO|nr:MULTISPECIES: carbohydrate ABC transporter permease [unclassified Demequina]MDN4478796.1 carbohydrate ABC transporter permease [Demequina sp. SYSU T00039-1]MDN4488894.1 carbohydrate ABC transporter permease [Demequina sp. SYSU T00039]
MSTATTTPTPVTAEPHAPAPKRRFRSTAITSRRPGWFTYGSLGIVLVAAIFPFYWSFLIGSGDQSTIYRDLTWIPGGNFLANAATVIDNPAINFWKALSNSVIVSTTTAVSTVVLSTLAGYAFAKLRFKGSGPLLVAVIATMAVPVQLGVVPLYILMQEYGWTGHLGAVIVPGLITAFGVFWMTQYLQQSLPTELIEAARVDGCSMIRTFWHVGLPAARPAASMLFLFTFVTSWNNFFWPFIVLDQQNPTLPVALSLLQANYFVDYSLVLAGVLLATVPLILLFIFTGRQLVSGIMQGAVKG